MTNTCNAGEKSWIGTRNRKKILNKNQETSIMYGFNNNVSIFGSLTARNVPYEHQMLIIGETGYTGTLHNNSVNLEVNSKKESVFRQSKLLMVGFSVVVCCAEILRIFHLCAACFCPQRSCTPW